MCLQPKVHVPTPWLCMYYQLQACARHKYIKAFCMLHGEMHTAFSDDTSRLDNLHV